ncbi:MAG: hypothetical protein KZQ70_05780 [gamma proteobacterium symbiont of Lucinoma myriamae]|nr:hypothetical protein [gamma proteobacterium symbiont of Lucinoma myriamae]MCU7832026.1 hypothetical protein [gamma proteobacterium symbiont of Lucinoma myriamae]
MKNKVKDYFTQKKGKSVTESKRSKALIQAQGFYDEKRKNKVRLPGTRLNDDDAEILKDAIELHGRTGKDTIMDALKLYIKKYK